MLKNYISVKEVKAEPMTRSRFDYQEKGIKILKSDEVIEDGYRVIYPDGYVSWRPKEEFEKHNFQFGSAREGKKETNSITFNDIQRFVAKGQVLKLGEKTAVTVTTLINGFEVIASSASLAKADYDENIGGPLAEQKMIDKVYELLGFLLQSARNGFAPEKENK